MTTYNGQKYIEEQLHSLCAQTYPIYEVIVCDDMSEDNTIDVVLGFKDALPLKVIKNKDRQGVVRNFRQAIANCTGDFIACCDQDDIWLPDKLGDSIELILPITGGRPALVYTDLQVIDSKRQIIAESFWTMREIDPSKTTFYSLLFGNTVTGCTMLFNRKMSDEVMKMPDQATMHDHWIACIAYSIGKVRFLKKQTVSYRQHETNVTVNKEVNFKNRAANLWSMINNGFGDFLSSQLNQAKLFDRIYQGILNEDNAGDLKRFINCEKLSPMFRKLMYHYMLRQQRD